MSSYQTLAVTIGELADSTGTWSYKAGSLSSSGSLTITGNCVGIRVFANGQDGGFKINSGDTINVRNGAGIDINPQSQLVNPVVAWVSGTLDVFIEVLA